MKEFIKYSGALLVLVGVIILAVYYFSQSNSNTLLAAAGCSMVVGFFAHIFLNKQLR